MGGSNTLVVGIIMLVLGTVVGYWISGSKATPSMSGVSMPAMMKPLSTSSTAEEKIANAMGAAPANIAKNASVLDYPAGEGKDFTTLRAGTNGWTCLPDDLTTPANDPVCVDGEAMKFFQAWMTKSTPKLAQAGLGYMLQGGGSPSNSDPFATKPAEGATWMHEPPHMMVFPTTPSDPKVYGTDPDYGGPYVMWANTPYAHLMMPVK